MGALLAKFVLLFADGKLKAQELVSFSISLFALLKDFLLRKALVKLLTYIPSWLSGPVGFAARILISIAIDKIIRPLFNLSIMKTWVYFKSRKFRKKGKKLEGSKNENEFDTNFDNLP